MQTRNRAAVLTALKTLEFRDIPMPVPKDDEIVVKMKAVGVCGSDVHYYSNGRIGDFVVDFPFILGHECAGVVTETGKNVHHLKVGDQVALEPGVPCGICEMCRTGHYNLCPDVKFLATPPYDGCLMDYMAFPAAYAYKLPSNISCVEGALLEPLAIGINAALTGGVELGNTVLIFGAGCIGLVTLLAAKSCGASKVVVSDVIPLRLETAEKMGAIVVNSKEEDLHARIAEITEGKGVDIVLDCAGFSSTVADAVRLVRPAGKVVVVGMGTDEWNGIPFGPITSKEIAITSIFRYKNLYPTAIAAVESGKIDISGIVSRVYNFEDTPEAYRTALECATETVKNVIVFPD